MDFTNTGPVAGTDPWRAQLDLAEAVNVAREPALREAERVDGGFVAVAVADLSTTLRSRDQGRSCLPRPLLRFP